MESENENSVEDEGSFENQLHLLPKKITVPSIGLANLLGRQQAKSLQKQNSEALITKKNKVDPIHSKLNREVLRKPRQGSEKPVSREQFLANQELQECRFSPKIEPNSEKIAKQVRKHHYKGQINEFLYEESKNRIQKSHILSQGEKKDRDAAAASRKVMPISHKHARNKLLKDLSKAMAHVNPGGSKYCGYEVMGKFCYTIGFFRIFYNPIYDTHNILTKQITERLEKEKDFLMNIWKSLSDKGNISCDLIMNVCVELFDSRTQSKDLISRNIDRLVERFYGKEKTKPKEVWSSEEIVRNFLILNSSNSSVESSNFLHSHKVVETKGPCYTFHPELCSKSRILAKARFSSSGRSHPILPQNEYSKLESSIELAANSRSPKIDTFDSRLQEIYAKHTELQERLNQEKVKQKIMELQECSFSPEISSLSPTMREHHQRAIKRLKNTSGILKERIDYKTQEEKRFEECTFHPKINQRHCSPSRYSNKKIASNDCIPRKLPPENAEIAIEVSIAPERTSKITLRIGDNLEKVASDFAKKHSLDKSIEKTLYQLLRKRIDNYLSQ